MCGWNGGGEEGPLTFWHPAGTSAGDRKKERWPCVLTDMFFIHYSPTNLFNQSLMLVWLAEEAANLVCCDGAVLTLAHPALILVLLRETVPEDLERLPYGLLAHCSDQRTTQFSLNQTRNIPGVPVSQSRTGDAHTRISGGFWLISHRFLPHTFYTLITLNKAK